MIFRTLKPEEFDAWCDHSQRMFAEERPGYFRDHFMMDPGGDLSLIFVAMDEGTIAATVRVFVRTIWLFGRTVPMGGIGEVSTNPAYRRQGLASELLQLAIAAMEARGMPVSILFGDQKIYAQAGWRFCDLPKRKIMTPMLPALAQDAQVRPFVPGDLDAVMGMYDLYIGRMNGAIVRSEAYWKRWVLPQWRSPFVLEREGRPVAYGCMPVEKNGQRLYVSELCAIPGEEGSLPGFVGHFAREYGCEHALVSAPLMQSVPGEEPFKFDMMVRLNSPVEGFTDTESLVAAMSQSAGMCSVDSF